MPKIAFSWFLPFCGIPSQVEHTREHNRIYTENKFWKRDTDWQNSLAIQLKQSALMRSAEPSMLGCYKLIGTTILLEFYTSKYH